MVRPRATPELAEPILIGVLYRFRRVAASPQTRQLSIPFAMTGSIWMLWLLDYNLSIAVWVGIIALAGLAAQTGTVMIIYLDEAFHAYQRVGRMRTQHGLFEAITYGAVQRVQPKLMTVTMITAGLLPALWASGAGAEAIQRIAAPMVGGLITAPLLSMLVIPAAFLLRHRRRAARAAR